MLKITMLDEATKPATLHLEGRVAGAWVAELKEVCERLLVTRLSLTGVSFLDDAGVSLLRELRSRGVAVTNCSPFVSAQLNGNGARL